MVVFYVILVVVLTIALVLCIAKIVSMESIIEHIMKSNAAQSEWVHTATDYLKELSKQDSHIVESLANIKSLLNGYQEDNIIKFDNLSSKQKKFNESITELITTNSHAVMEKLNTIPTAEDMYDELTSQTAEITEAIKATKKTTRAKTAKA